MHYSPHSLFKILKKLSEPIQSYEDGSFLGHNGPFVPNKHFLGKIIHLPIDKFHRAKFKKNLQ